MKAEIKTEFIKLDSAIKYVGAAENGAEAKIFIKEGKVKVNGETELRRGKKLYKGDKFELFDEEYEIV